MKMKITQYGYHGDPYMDSYTAKGEGAYHNLQADVSCAMTDSARAALGAPKHAWVEIKFAGGATQYRRIDDRAPEQDKRCDLYNPGGFQAALGDFADVTLSHSQPDHTSHH
jgi:hypothetical protein